MAPSEHPLKKT